MNGKNLPKSSQARKKPLPFGKEVVYVSGSVHKERAQLKITATIGERSRLREWLGSQRTNSVEDNYHLRARTAQTHPTPSLTKFSSAAVEKFPF